MSIQPKNGCKVTEYLMTLENDVESLSFSQFGAIFTQEAVPKTHPNPNPNKVVSPLNFASDFTPVRCRPAQASPFKFDLSPEFQKSLRNVLTELGDAPLHEERERRQDHTATTQASTAKLPEALTKQSQPVAPRTSHPAPEYELGRTPRTERVAPDEPANQIAHAEPKAGPHRTGWTRTSLPDG